MNLLDYRREFLGLALLISLFTFWSTMRMFENLWPGADTRPMVLPMIHLFFTGICFLLCLPGLIHCIAERKWWTGALYGTVSVSPFVVGYLGLLIQMKDIGFILSG